MIYDWVWEDNKTNGGTGSDQTDTNKLLGKGLLNLYARMRT